MSAFNTFGLNSLRRFPDEQDTAPTSRAARLAELAVSGAMRAVVPIADLAMRGADMLPKPNGGANAAIWGPTDQERFPSRATLPPESTAVIMANLDAVIDAPPEF